MSINIFSLSSFSLPPPLLFLGAWKLIAPSQRVLDEWLSILEERCMCIITSHPPQVSFLPPLISSFFLPFSSTLSLTPTPHPLLPPLSLRLELPSKMKSLVHETKVLKIWKFNLHFYRGICFKCANRFSLLLLFFLLKASPFLFSFHSHISKTKQNKTNKQKQTYAQKK